MKKIVILFSGEGTNLENLIIKLHESKKVEVIKAISNNANANGIKRAQKLGVKTVVIESKNFKTKSIRNQVICYQYKHRKVLIEK